MKSIILCAAFVAFCGLCVGQDLPPFTDKECIKNAYPPAQERNIGNFILNLDLPPEDRWTPLVKKHAPQMQELLAALKSFVGNIVANKTRFFEIVDDLLGPLSDTFPEPYRSELRGIAKAANMQLGDIVLYNIFYEINPLCTSIVGQDKTGKLFHARNMDYGEFLGWTPETQTWTLTETLKPTIANVIYQKNGTTVAKAVHFAGYIGVITGIKQNVMTISMNSRSGNSLEGYLQILEYVLGARDRMFTGFFNRDVMMNSTSFEMAKKHIMNDKILSNAYFILGGSKAGEGAVISRSRDALENVRMLNPSNGTWFLAQTNYDSFKQNPPFFDNRLKPAKKCINELTQAGFNLEGIFNVLATKPVLNLATAYTALMQVNEGHLESYIGRCPQPCYPW